MINCIKCISRVANMMVSECGLHPGDRVMVILPRIPQWWLINLAAMRSGKLYIPLLVPVCAGSLIAPLS